MFHFHPFPFCLTPSLKLSQVLGIHTGGNRWRQWRCNPGVRSIRHQRWCYGGDRGNRKVRRRQRRWGWSSAEHMFGSEGKTFQVGVDSERLLSLVFHLLVDILPLFLAFSPSSSVLCSPLLLFPCSLTLLLSPAFSHPLAFRAATVVRTEAYLISAAPRAPDTFTCHELGAGGSVSVERKFFAETNSSIASWKRHRNTNPSGRRCNRRR
jgi:hypothetical protein